VGCGVVEALAATDGVVAPAAWLAEPSLIVADHAAAAGAGDSSQSESRSSVLTFALELGGASVDCDAALAACCVSGLDPWLDALLRSGVADSEDLRSLAIAVLDRPV
jgi:hypothetical protein